MTLPNTSAIPAASLPQPRAVEGATLSPGAGVAQQAAPVDTMSDTLFLECLLFVQEQSCGEWGDAIEAEDARKLEAFVRRQIASAMEARQGGDAPAAPSRSDESAAPKADAQKPTSGDIA